MANQDSTPPEPIIRFTVDMPESLHHQLSMAAARMKKKKVELARFAIAQLLKDLDDDAVVG